MLEDLATWFVIMSIFGFGMWALVLILFAIGEARHKDD